MWFKPYKLSMDSEHKKAYLLLMFLIICCHGIDNSEKVLLENTAVDLDAQQELKWVYDFAGEDIELIFDRCKSYFSTSIATYPKETKLDYLSKVWDATNKKGYITEMEAMTILKLAKEWGVQRDLLALVRK